MHSRTINGVRYIWKVEDLWVLAKDLPICEVDPNLIINLETDAWFGAQTPTPRLILEHMKRILNADLSYPIILDHDGTIMDGGHRACRAILEGKTKVLVKYFVETPPHSEISEPV